MTIDDLVTFDSVYCVPISNNADQALAPVDPQGEYPQDLFYYFCELKGQAGVAPQRNVYAHESAPYTMNPLALAVEGAILAQPHPWQFIPNVPEGRYGVTWPIVEQAPEVDPYTQPLMPEPRSGYSGIYPYEWHTRIPFPNAWE